MARRKWKQRCRASASGEFALNFVRQEPQLGTGHAVQQTVPVLRDDGIVVVLSGDVPLTQADTLQHLIAACAGTQLALLTIDFADPTGYGRIVRVGDAVQAIVEQKDATPGATGHHRGLQRHHGRACGCSSNAGWRGSTTTTPRASTT